jgi:hypothetical protein
VTYGLLAEVFNELIEPVLEQKLQEMKEYMDGAVINYTVDNNDNFKIAPVGGFCNFYLTQKKINDFFNRGGAEDMRFHDIIRDRGECEKAISFGTALIANERIDFKQLAPYSLGIVELRNENGEEKKVPHWALHKGDEIAFNQPYYVRRNENHSVFSVSNCPPIAFNFTNVAGAWQSGEPLQRYRERLTLDGLYKLAFSFDESMMITLHKYSVVALDNGTWENRGGERRVTLDDIANLLGGGVLAIQPALSPAAATSNGGQGHV